MLKTSKKLALAGVLTSLICSTSFADLVSTVDETSPNSAQKTAQEFATGKNINITYNIFSTLIGTLAGSVEYKISKPVSLGVTGAYMFNDYVNDDSNTNTGGLKYYSIGAFATFAFNKNVMATGWLIQPTVEYADVSYTDNTQINPNVDLNGVSIEAPFIYQWMWDSGFNMRLGLGPAYTWLHGSTDSNNPGSSTNGTASGLGLTGMFTLGYAL
jgi:hypothetical protein